MKDLITKKIKEYFDSGIILKSDTMDYFASVTGLDSILDIELLDSFEKDSFLELVFFPDDDIRILIEEILAMEVPEKEDIKTIKESVKRDTLTVIHGKDRIIQESDPAFINKFIDRLNLANPMKKNLGIKMEDHHGVKLRNSKLPIDGRVLDFLRELYSKRDKFIWFDDIFNLSVDILKEYKDGDIINLFIEKKLFYATLIQKDMYFKELLKKHNIETLMMQGVSSVSVDVDDAFEKIKLINQINRIVFSYTNLCDHEHFTGEEMNIAEDVEDLLDIFRK